MKRLILDASVAVKWYLASPSEPLLAEADLLLQAWLTGQVHFAVPDLFFAEVANVFWKAERQRRCDPAASRTALAGLLAQPIESHPIRPLAAAAAALARRHGCAVYDAIYVALALEQGADLITADRELAARGSLLPVRWLGAYRL